MFNFQGSCCPFFGDSFVILSYAARVVNDFLTFFSTFLYVCEKLFQPPISCGAALLKRTNKWRAFDDSLHIIQFSERIVKRFWHENRKNFYFFPHRSASSLRRAKKHGIPLLPTALLSALSHALFTQNSIPDFKKNGGSSPPLPFRRPPLTRRRL